ELVEVVPVEVAGVSADRVVDPADREVALADVLIRGRELEQPPPARPSHGLLDHLAPSAPSTVHIAVRRLVVPSLAPIGLEAGIPAGDVPVAVAVGEGRAPREPLVADGRLDGPDVVVEGIDARLRRHPRVVVADARERLLRLGRLVVEELRLLAVHAP